MLNCCSHDNSEAEATNDGQGVQEKATGGYPKMTKAAKKRAAKRRGQARSKEPMSCLLLTCILRIIGSFEARSLVPCVTSPLLHPIAAVVTVVVPREPPWLSWFLTVY